MDTQQENKVINFIQSNETELTRLNIKKETRFFQYIKESAPYPCLYKIYYTDRRE